MKEERKKRPQFHSMLGPCMMIKEGEGFMEHSQEDLVQDIIIRWEVKKVGVLKVGNRRGKEEFHFLNPLLTSWMMKTFKTSIILLHHLVAFNSLLISHRHLH